MCASTCYILSALEGLFLIVEHESLLRHSNHDYDPPEHPSLDASATPPNPPTPPDPAVLRRAFVRCGTDQMVPLKVALERALKPLILQYRERVPQNQWRAVCLQCTRITHTVIDTLRAQTEASKRKQAYSVVSGSMHDGAVGGDRGATSARCNTASRTSSETQEVRVLVECVSFRFESHLCCVDMA